MISPIAQPSGPIIDAGPSTPAGFATMLATVLGAEGQLNNPTIADVVGSCGAADDVGTIEEVEPAAHGTESAGGLDLGDVSSVDIVSALDAGLTTKPPADMPPEGDDIEQEYGDAPFALTSTIDPARVVSVGIATAKAIPTVPPSPRTSGGDGSAVTPGPEGAAARGHADRFDGTPPTTTPEPADMTQRHQAPAALPTSGAEAPAATDRTPQPLRLPAPPAARAVRPRDRTVVDGGVFVHSPQPSAVDASLPAAADPVRGVQAPATLLRTDTVRYLRELGPARAVQRLAVDLDGSMVAVRLDHNGGGVRVEVVDDPSGRLGGTFTTDVERALTARHAGGSAIAHDGGHGGDPRRQPGQEQRTPDDAPSARTARRWADAATLLDTKAHA